MEDIKLCSDGKYRWIYEFKMLKNPVILLTIWKMFLYILLGMWVVFGLFRLRYDSFPEAMKNQLLDLSLPAAILLVLSVVAYLILAGIYGWTYCVLFEMDNEGIRHVQMEKQVKKAEALSFITVMMGIAANNPTAIGAGILSSSKSESYSEFSKVKKVKYLPALNTIKLSSPFNHNQIYADGENYQFVKKYIEERLGTQNGRI